ncbi:Hypothetical predicted protein, partial [Paramuricea clavata]
MVVLKSKQEGSISNVSSIFLAIGRDKVLYPSRNSGLSRRYRTSSCVPTSLKASSALYLAKTTMCAGYLILLAGDVNINPGPVGNRALECPACCKIIRCNQARSSCMLCEHSYHLKCLGADYDLTGYCRQCSVPSDDLRFDIEELNISPKLAKVIELRGLKILHQNIQSLRCKIDELRLLLHKLNSGVQLLAITETWANRNITDEEFEIPGYNLYRKDRGSKGGGVAVFVRNDLVITRGEDLEKSDVEGLEITLPKSRSFLLGTFYRAPNSSTYYDKNFMFKLENILDIAVSQNQEVILLGDWNTNFLQPKATIAECKQLKALFRTLNRVTNSIRRAKESYNRRIIEENSNDSKAFWKTIKKVLPGESKKLSPTMFDENDNVCHDKHRIANMFNRFFVTVVDRLRESFVTPMVATWNYVAVGHLQQSHRQPFQFNDVTESFVLTQLSCLKIRKAPGLDNIPPRLLKDSATIIAEPLANIINASLRQMQAASKLLEKAVHMQLCGYLLEHKILSPYQCGFRKLHSTQSAALSFADTIRRNIDQGIMTGAVFIDLSKAFDSIDHSILLKKLFSMSIVGREHEWFADYLRGRTQIVDYQGTFSDQEAVIVGVPQGSILGPLLFVLHVNDLPSVIRHCQILMYADGTVVFYSGKIASTILRKLTEDLDVIGSWLCSNSLFLNVTKTEAMLF